MTVLTKNTAILRAEVDEHLAKDALVRGRYWDASKGKGCFIGCLTHSSDPNPAFERFGLPVMLMRVAENIFESLPDAEGRKFFAALPDAVGCDGKDLSRVVWAFFAAELRALPPQTAEVQAVIDPVIAGMDTLASGGQWDSAYVAANAAYAATDSVAADATHAAADAAYAAARAAYTAADATHAAADATYAAADAAYAAARAARADDAAARAARAAARIRQRDTLLALIAAAEVVA